MWRRVRDWIAGLTVGIVLAGLLVSAGAGDELELFRVSPFSTQNLWLIKQARAIVETYFVNGSEDVTEDDLLYGAIRGMVAAYGDPYTRFVDPGEMKEEEIEMQGEYGGLGIYISQRDGQTVIVSPIEDTPADRVGLKPKDSIVKIGDEVIIGWDQNDVVSNLRGKPGTSVTIWVRREGEENLLRFDIVREKIKIKSVRFEMLPDKVGYLRIIQFNQRTVSEFRNALDSLVAQGASSLVLDLRNNPGGLLDVCVDVADMFLDNGVIVSTKGRFQQANEVLYATGGVKTDLPLAVLINEGSASASEIVAGALKDHDRAVIVGQQSFGKGSVQTLFTLPDESGIYVTIAKYYTPDGTVIDKTGLAPDIEVEGEFSREAGHEDDTQLHRAIEELTKTR